MISAFVASYGYLAVFVGTVLEGETILIAAGFASHQHLLHWPVVVLVAVCGAWLGDTLAFAAGKWKGEALLRRYPLPEARMKYIRKLLHRHDATLVLTLRFLYGLRIAGPVILGANHLPFIRFISFNLLGAVIWAVLISGIGYLLGATATSLVGDLRHIEEAIMATILAVGLALWLWRKFRSR